MTEEKQQEPIEAAGGYGTPTAEQELPGGDTKFAQPREEEAFDAAGLSQDSPDGETYPAGAPDLRQFGAEDQDSAGEPGAGRFGGTEKQMSSENASTAPGYDADTSENSAVAMPSSEAEMDGSNAEEPDTGRPFSSESGQDAAGLPDGSGTDGPENESAKDASDDEEPFDAG